MQEYTDRLEEARFDADAAQDINYDIVFMDCHMPEMDGFEATASLNIFGAVLFLFPVCITIFYLPFE